MKIDAIQRVVCADYKVPLAEMRGPSRATRIARPRAMAMYLARELTEASFEQIGRRFGDRSASTVGLTVANVERRRSKDERFADELHVLRLSCQAAQEGVAA